MSEKDEFETVVATIAKAHKIFEETGQEVVEDKCPECEGTVTFRFYRVAGRICFHGHCNNCDFSVIS